ncbi:hypothetical protein AB0B79_35255, partial [Streptomyces sp. NPDC039022]
MGGDLRHGGLPGGTDTDSIRTGAEARTAGPPKAVGVVWGLLILNTLGSAGAKTIIPLPRSLIQLVTMGALVAAFTLALALNLRLRIRASAFLLLLTLLLVPSVLSSLQLESGLGVRSAQPAAQRQTAGPGGVRDADA